jgi:hypothetical protein
VDILHITEPYGNDMEVLRSRYEQAYLVEQAKLAQSVTVCQGQQAEIEKLKRETGYYQQHMIPHYEHLVSCQKEEIREMQKALQYSEDRRRFLEQKSCEEREELDEHRRAHKAMVDLPRASHKKLKALTAGAKQNSTSLPRVSARLRQRNGGTCQGVVGALEKNELVKRRTRGRGKGS